ncbi:extra-cytoplasmic solute receptor [Delftia sp. Cs1-4]|uniref:Bug family tripartite tricarboxylate transporter substrate binding protein n=1 Tax=Delftia sp. (strain Cs1-4) TaxID=742013 RepID=UPI00020E7BDF|nr:tripartite tricarboxylate transporter substrate binding protein [Delftia sp. Cs1-4]AEF88814.1 extra-cytoplasmic solute receptor [Delftia sp. Cs1-4]
MKLNRRSILLSAIAAAALPATAQEGYPNRPIRIIVPIAAGGATDVQARAMADSLQKVLKVPIVVENKPGGNFVIGNVAVATAPADGYTIGWALSAAMALNPILYKQLPYRPENFQPLAVISKGHHVIAVPANAKANTLAEWVDEIKRSGRAAPVGVSSVGGTTHLMAEDLGMKASFTVEPIVYRGEAPAVQDLLAGNLPGFSGIVASVLDHYKVGRLKVLAISSDQRIADMPNVPTFKELGYDIGVTYWNGIVAPADTPKPVVERLAKAIAEVKAGPEFKARLAAIPDMHLIAGEPDQMRKMVRDDSAYWGRIIKARNIKIDQ